MFHLATFKDKTAAPVMYIIDLYEQYIDHILKLNLRKSANVGDEKIRRSFPGQICFVFLFSLHDCSHPSSQRYHLPISGLQRTATLDAVQCNPIEYNPMQSAHRKDATRWTSVKYMHCIKLQCIEQFIAL